MALNIRTTTHLEVERASAWGRLGVVAIGRNEGQRLKTCLASIDRRVSRVVYVDSGSTDGSVEVARGHGVEVIELDPAERFTAARARNAGFAWLSASGDPIDLVQFVDGDCELDREWLTRAMAIMNRRPDLAVICGRRRERYADASIYNRLCDLEWDTPAGEVESCGGDALIRAAAFEAVGGFARELIAGEEPDLCHRLRRQGWIILRVAIEMTVHDAAMMRPAQWWLRNKRSGHATAEAWRRRGIEEPRLLRQLLSNVFWALPVAWPAWPLLWWRVFRRRGALFATHVVLGKIPHLHGQVSFWLDNWRARRSLIIEYK